MTDVVDLIDGALRDYDLSADAMRWMADPPKPIELTPAQEENRAQIEVALRMGYAPPPYQPGSAEFGAVLPTIQSWLVANRIDPNVVPIWTVPLQVKRWLLYDAYVKDGSGKLRWDPVAEQAVSEVRRQLLFEPAPEVLRPWLATGDSDNVDRLLLTWHRRFRRLQAMRRAYSRRHRR